MPEPSGPPPRPWSLAFDFFRGRIAAYRLGRETSRWYVDMWSDANPGWKRTQEYLLEMDRQLRQRRARLLVAPWPLLVGLEGRYPFESAHENIRRFCLAKGIAHRDLLPALRGWRSADLWVHPVDRHPNEIAQRLAAEALAPDVEKLIGP